MDEWTRTNELRFVTGSVKDTRTWAERALNEKPRGGWWIEQKWVDGAGNEKWRALPDVKVEFDTMDELLARSGGQTDG